MERFLCQGPGWWQQSARWALAPLWSQPCPSFRQQQVATAHHAWGLLSTLTPTAQAFSGYGLYLVPTLHVLVWLSWASPCRSLRPHTMGLTASSAHCSLGASKWIRCPGCPFSSFKVPSLCPSKQQRRTFDKSASLCHFVSLHFLLI